MKEKAMIQNLEERAMVRNAGPAGRHTFRLPGKKVYVRRMKQRVLGGIHIPDYMQGKTQWGEVLGAGMDADPELRKGDTVAIPVNSPEGKLWNGPLGNVDVEYAMEDSEIGYVLREED